MENTNGIYKKLLEFASKEVRVEKDAQNAFMKNKYTTLNEVLSKVEKPLADLGLVVSQYGEVIEGQAGLTTELTEVESGDSIKSFFPFVGASDAQKLGANITYLRRYALIALLGLQADDDDGNSAVSGEKQTKGDITMKPPF